MKDNLDAIALFDLDGSLADYMAKLREDFRRIASPGEPLVDPYADEGWVGERTRMIKNQPGWWANLPRFQLGFDVLDVARRLSFENHVLTQGPNTIPEAWAGKKIWCEREVPDLPVTITRKKSLMYGRVLCDDYPEYFMAWLAVRPRGLVVAPAQPWNAGKCDHPQVVRYDGTNLREVEDRMAEARYRT